jgi:hypothetical protein
MSTPPSFRQTRAPHAEETSVLDGRRNHDSRHYTKARMPESCCLLAIRALLAPLRAGAEDGGPGRRKPVQHQAHRRKTDTEPVGQLALAAQPSAAKELAETLPSSPPGYPAAASPESE